MSISIEGNVIKIPIFLDIQRPEEAGQQQDAHVQAFNRFQREQAKDLTAEELQTVRNMLQNPQGFFMNLFTRQLPILGGIYSAKQVLDFLLEEMFKPGGPYDRRFKRIIETEFNNLRTPEHNWAVRRGLKQIIITTSSGQRGYGGDTNNLRSIREESGREFEFTIYQKSLGLFN